MNRRRAGPERDVDAPQGHAFRGIAPKERRGRDLGRKNRSFPGIIDRDRRRRARCTRGHRRQQKTRQKNPHHETSLQPGVVPRGRRSRWHLSASVVSTHLRRPHGRGDRRSIVPGVVGQIVNLRPISNRPAADAAARIRAMYGLRTPDSLQAATAVRSHVTGLVTNDPVFERVDLFETLVLDRVL